MKVKHAKNQMIILILILSSSGFASGQESWKSAHKIIEKRCVSCHSCYSSPCQIDLSSFEGINRGGTKEAIYNSTRLFPANPTRLFIDATSSSEWHRQHNFYPITGATHHQKSILLESVRLGVNRGFAYRDYDFNNEKGTTCPAPKEWEIYSKSNKVRGMPFGFPPLKKPEIATLSRWEKAGFAGSEPTDLQLINRLPEKVRRNITKWEKFLNQSDLKHKITSRYLYEHLFLAHINFENHPKLFLRLVRSKTKAPHEIQEIATVRPFDDPKTAKFYYRFRPLRGTVVYKNHIIFPFSDNRLKNFNKLFIQAKWVKDPKTLPSYEPELSANPFVTFRDMPPLGRYKFLIENARYFSMTFIRGPVCEGQVAVNVIRDHFIVFFQDPDYDLSVTDPSYLLSAAKLLTLPASGKSSPFKTYYKSYKQRQKKYAKYRADSYSKEKKLKFSSASVWDGDGVHDDAVLTIFRHFDNSSVITGAWGGTSKTVWIMDYPIFERMYYLLVAGFNVFDNVFHQASTRMYMDNLRVESENNFLYLLPKKLRMRVRNSWYLGGDAQEKMNSENPMYSDQYNTPEDSTRKNLTTKPRELVNNLTRSVLQERMTKVVNQSDPLHCCLFKNPKSIDKLEKSIQKLTKETQSFARYMPELTIMVAIDPKSKKTKVFFVSKLTDHKNVSFMFEEDQRLAPKNDRLIVTNKWVGSYPNYFIYGSTKHMERFINDVSKAKSKESVEKILTKYGVTRNQKNFWDIYDVIEQLLATKYSLEYGRLDLSKYKNLYR